MKSTHTPFFVFLFLCFANAAHAQQTVGLYTRTLASQDGYVLFSPAISDTTYLIDKCGKRVHTWHSTHLPGQSAHLREDGSLLRPAVLGNTTFTGDGAGGSIEVMNWNSSMLWSYTISTDSTCQHNDVCMLPNGNMLVLIWERKTAAEAIAYGRIPTLASGPVWSEKIVELHPNGTGSADIVWEWRAWDHLVQDTDPGKPAFGSVSGHPELVNINYIGTGSPLGPDWLHVNSVAYNPGLDQIMLSVSNLSEIWVIDHSTTPVDAAGHVGGSRDKGGDLLYRWGNSEAYSRGNATNHTLYGLRNAHWIEDGLQDAGRIMIFNNGVDRPGTGTRGSYSTIDVIDPPLDPGSGNYILPSNGAYGPMGLLWQYKATVPQNLSETAYGGAQRLPGGNTLINEGTEGNLFEIDYTGKIVWQYISPVIPGGIDSQGKIANMNFTAHATQYPVDYAGLKTQSLIPGGPLEGNPLPTTCTMIVRTGIALQPSKGQQLSVVNPFDDAVVLQTGRDVQAATVTLSAVTGAVCRAWSDLQLRAGTPVKLDIGRSLPAGMYLLQVNMDGVREVVKLVH